MFKIYLKYYSIIDCTGVPPTQKKYPIYVRTRSPNAKSGPCQTFYFNRIFAVLTLILLLNYNCHI